MTRCSLIQELASAAKAKAERSASVQQVSERLNAANTRLAALETESSDTAERALVAQVESDKLYKSGELQVLLPIPPPLSLSLWGTCSDQDLFFSGHAHLFKHEC